MKNRQILLPGMFLLSLAACSSGEPTGDAVAVVNKHRITVSEVEERLKRLANLPGRDYSTNEKKRELVDELINQDLLVQAALKEGILEKSDRLRQDIAREYLRMRASEKPYKPTEEEVKAFWEEKKDQMERIQASHILIKPDKPGDPASEQTAKAKAEKLLAQIRKGADFAKLAQEQSQDLSNKDRGGNLFFFDRSRMVPEFSKVAFALQKVGDVSDVVKTQYGYHIIKLTGEHRGMDQFRTTIEWQIANRSRQDQTKTLFQKLRSDASIKYYDDNLAKVRVSSPAMSPHGDMPPHGGMSPSIR